MFLLQDTSIKKLNSIYLNNTGTVDDFDQAKGNIFNMKLMQYGYILNAEATELVSKLPDAQLEELLTQVVNSLQKIVGANVRHRPMYKGFPREVQNKSHLELFVNALVHYWSFGNWMPESEDVFREYAIEVNKLQTLGVATSEDIDKLCEQIAYSKDSISEQDLKLCLDRNINYDLTKVSIKEILIPLAAVNPLSSVRAMNTTTDVLRLLEYMSHGTSALEGPFKVVSLKRSMRRAFVNRLEQVISEEDVNRHYNQWKRVFHSLHVGEYRSAVKVNTIANKVRNNVTMKGFNSEVERLILEGNDLSGLLNLLSTRPSMFSRRIMELLNKFDLPESRLKIVHAYAQIVHEVPNRLLFQLMNLLYMKANGVEKMVVFPKGKTQHAKILDRKDNDIETMWLNELKESIEVKLYNSFVDKDELGSVYVDPLLKGFPLPTQQRSASEGKFSLARGSALPFGDKKFLRFFVYWTGQDIDLSAGFHDSNFKFTDRVAYTQLKNGCAAHSGDIIRAPNGASEFIDIDIEKALSLGHRFVSMNVYVYSGPNFVDHRDAFVGFMTLNHDDKNEIYQPDQVQHKIDLVGESRYSLPAFFDLKERKMYWMDVYNNIPERVPNNVENNQFSLSDMVELTYTKSNYGYSLYDLFTTHGKSRGNIVDTPGKADVTFGVDQINDLVTPFNITEINSNWV